MSVVSSPNSNLKISDSCDQDGDIRVDIPNPVYGDSPFTVQTGQCGVEGQYIQVEQVIRIWFSFFKVLQSNRLIFQSLTNRSEGLMLKLVYMWSRCNFICENARIDFFCCMEAVSLFTPKCLYSRVKSLGHSKSQSVLASLTTSLDNCQPPD